MTGNNTKADIAALKAIVATLIGDDLDEESRQSLAGAATHLIRNYTKDSEEIKREAIERITNLLDLAA